MGRVLASFTIFILTLSFQASPAERTKPKPGLTVRIYDYARVSDDVLAQARRIIRWLMREAGIEVKLLPCSSGDGQQTVSDCLKPLGPTELVVRIMRGFGPGRKHQLGVSVGETLATVYYQQAGEFAADKPASERVGTGQILGYGIVHEIGHLLLPQMPHSPAGIMRADWSAEDLNLMQAGRLRFTADQAKGMQVEVTRRAQRMAIAHSVE